MIREELRLQPGARVLVADHRSADLALIGGILEGAGHEFFGAGDGEEALRRVRADFPEVVVLDVALPRLNGFQVCERIKSHPRTRLVPVLLMATPDSDVKARGIAVGADDFLAEPLHELEVLARVRSLVQCKRLNEQLDQTESVVYELARALEERDAYTGSHGRQLAEYACRLGRAACLPPDELETLRKGAILHDIGKIGVRESTLLKSGNLTPEEFNEIRLHPLIGERLILPLRCAEDVLPVIRHHGERWDGRGYPDGLRGEQIPPLARILAIAEAFDALTSDRPYRPSMSPAEAADVLRDGAGQQWDPELVELLLASLQL
jgi:cyclic di-GMP phosphodiesterase